MIGKNNIAFGLMFMAGFMVYGFFLIYLRDFAPDKEQWIALSGMLMPLGILAEVYFGASPIFVLVGAMAIIVAVLWLGFEVFKLKII